MNDKVKEITEQLHEGVKNLFESEKYKEYLKTMSKFSHYSFSNTLLIALQRPDASAVAGYKSWESKFDRHVVKGAKGIAIIQPAPYRKKIDMILKDEDGKPVLDAEGKEVRAQVERMVENYKVGWVYAYEDTDGKPLPEIVSTLNGKVENYDELKDILASVSKVPISYENFADSANGYYSPVEERIVVKASLPELQSIKTTIHEIAHSILHNRDDGTDQEATRREKEVEAESVAFTVSTYLGLDTSDYSFGYVAGWSAGRELKELQDKMELIRKTANTIITGIEAEIQSRRMSQTDELAYKNGNGYFEISRSASGYDYTVYDLGLRKISSGTVTDINIRIDEAAKLAMESHGIRSDFQVPMPRSELHERISQATESIQESQTQNNTHRIKVR